MALYESLKATSTPEEIAAAYREYVGMAGGDTQQAQEAAVNYLTNLGISAPTIQSAYQSFLGTPAPAPAPVRYSTPAPAPVSAPAPAPAPAPVTGALQKATQAEPLYTGLTASSTPQQIADAYREYVGMAGGDTQQAQEAAVDYLTKLGVQAPTIEQAYKQFLGTATTPTTVDQTKTDVVEPWDYNKYLESLKTSGGDYASALGRLSSQNPDMAKGALTIYDQIKQQQEAGSRSAWSSGRLADTDAAAADFALRLSEAGLSSLYDLGQRQVERVVTDEGGTWTQIEPELFNKKTGESLADWGRLASSGPLDLNYRFDFQDGVPIPYTTKKPSDWVEFREGVLKPAISLASLAFPAITPYGAAGNAITAAQKGDWGTAIVSGITAMGGITGLPTEVAEGLKTARSAASILNAIEKGNPLAIANALSQTDVGKQLISTDIGNGITIGNVLDTAKIAAAVDKGQYAEALNYAGSLVNNPNLMVAGSALNVVKAIEAGNPFNIINTLGQLQNAVAKASPPSGGITDRVYDDTIVQAGADAFLRAKEAGASDEDAMAAANAVTSPVADVPPSTATITTPKDLGEFAGLDEAIAAQDAAKTQERNLERYTSLQSDFAASLGKKSSELTEEEKASFDVGLQNVIKGDLNKITESTIADVLKGSPSIVGKDYQGRWIDSEGYAYDSKGFKYAPGSDVPMLEIRGVGDRVPGYIDEITGQFIPEDNKTVQPLDVKIDNAAQTFSDWLRTVPEDKRDIIQQAVSTTAGLFGEQIADLGTAFANMGFADKYNAMVRIGEALERAGVDLEIPEVTEATQKFWDAVSSEGTYGEKVAEGFKAIIENPLVLVQVAKEAGQEALPMLLGGGVYKLLEGAGKMALVAGAGTDMLLNAAESMGSTSRQTYKEEIAKGTDPEEADRLSKINGAKAFWITTLTAGATDASLIKSAETIMNKIGAKAATSYGKEWGSEGFEEFAISLATGDSLDEAIAKSLAGSFIGSKTSGSIQASSDAAQIAAEIKNDFVQGYAENGLTSTDGSFRPETIVQISETQDKSPESLADNVAAAVESGNDPSTIIGDYVAEVLHGGGSVDSVVEAATNAAQGTDAQIDFDSNSVTVTNPSTGVQSSIDVSTGTKTTVDSNNNVTTTVDSNTNTTTTVDANNNTTSQTTVDSNTNTQTTVTVDTNTKTQTVVDSNTNTITSTTVDTNSNVTTQTTIDTNTNTQTTVVTDTNTNTQTTIKVNTDTGDIIDEVETAIPSGWTPPVINDPVVPDPVAPAKTTAAPKSAAPQTVGTAGLAGGKGAMLPSTFEMDETLLPSRVTQKAIDPLARVMQAQAELEKTAMMQQIDPRLLSVLQQRMAPEQQQALQQAQQQQFDKDIGALSRLLSGQPANTSDYYSYGSEDSIDSILGGRAVGFKEGGYVEPLKAAEGGMALPLLAKSGGALSHYGGREDYKDGKHVAGEGDGQSDDIPAWLADGEFVFPADVVSALGNGSTKAGTDKLYEMMHSIRERARSKGPKDLPPPALKSPLDYLKSSKRS